MSVTATGARPYPDKWPRESATPLVERYHSAVRALAAEKFEASGLSWEQAVEQGALRIEKRICFKRNARRGVRIQSHQESAARFGAILIDNGNWNVPERLSEIGLGVEYPIE